ncbi:hypothetical protein RV04_GL002286 [Enterococcus hermanniensis]|uniref:DUF3841 domain-containing protein n=1 Tax=Enterococcus hermanniensis TaxID=249189 RepID=A0A1L8TM52_9ENTE|nr:hypothetical protein RV04_GL002286 [Enterococcus hermanniensis]
MIDKLKTTKRYVAKSEFIQEKYGEVAPVFLQAYAWYRHKAANIVSLPKDAESAIWTFTDSRYLNNHEDSMIMELYVPMDKIVFFRMSDWNKILNLQCLGNELEVQQYKDKLKKFNITYEGEVFNTSFYPLLKRELLISWEKLFQYDEWIKRTKELPFNDMQGGLWEIQASWIRSFID